MQSSFLRRLAWILPSTSVKTNMDRRMSRRVGFVQYIAFITGMLLAYFWGFLMEILLICEGFQGAHHSCPIGFRSQVHLEISLDGRGNRKL